MRKLVAISIFGLLTSAGYAYSGELKSLALGFVAPVVDDTANFGNEPVGTIVYDASAGVYKGKTTGAGAWTDLSHAAGAQRVERLTVAGPCTATPCTVTESSGPWYSVINHNGTGMYTIVFNTTAGTSFSAPPSCVVSIYTPGGAYGVEGLQAVSWAVSFDTFSASTLAKADTGFNIICVGPSN